MAISVVTGKSRELWVPQASNPGVGMESGHCPLGKHSCSSWETESAQGSSSKPSPLPILWCKLQPLEPRLCLRTLGIRIPATPEAPDAPVSSASRPGLGPEQAGWVFVDLTIGCHGFCFLFFF